MAQAVHAALEFSTQHPELTTDWLTASNYLVIVNAPTEDLLHQLIATAKSRGIVAVSMVEPDLNNQVTAVALQPGPEARKLCANLPLALRSGS